MILALILALTPAQQADRLVTIHNRLAAASPELCAQGCGKPVLLDQDGINARYFWRGAWIGVSPQLIARDDDTLAFALAHEIGHHVSQSTDHGEADRIAVRLTQAAGFDPLAGADMLGRYLGGKRRAEAIRAMVR